MNCGIHLLHGRVCRITGKEMKGLLQEIVPPLRFERLVTTSLLGGWGAAREGRALTTEEKCGSRSFEKVIKTEGVFMGVVVKVWELRLVARCGGFVPIDEGRGSDIPIFGVIFGGTVFCCCSNNVVD